MPSATPSPATQTFGRAMQAHFPLAPDVTYLNHGTVGVVPKRVLAAKIALLEEMERAPSTFMLRELSGAKQKRAQAQKRIHETMAGLNDQSAFETFERMADKIEESERRAVAAAEVSEVLSGDTLEQQFQQLKPANESVEFRLLELKQKMGMSLPAGQSGGNAKRLGTGTSESGPVRDAEIEEEA
jgi:phage shock protein A